MTKITKTKLALLGATALFTATSAHAQVADTWTINGDVTVTASTTDATDGVKLDTSAGTIDGANIADGYKNSISAAAVGASASQSFTAFNAAGAGFGTTAAASYGGNVQVQAGNEVAVSNLSNLTSSPTISTGQGNSISIAAVGASASGGATLSAAGGTDGNTFSLSLGGTTTIQAGDGVAAITDTADAGGNIGDVSVATGDPAIENPVITTGNANSISLAGVGSSASFGLTFNTGGAGQLPGAISTIATASNLDDLLTVTSTNTGDVTISQDGTAGGDVANLSAANILAGSGNSISAATVGSSASVSVADNVFALTSGVTGTIDFSDIAVASRNEGVVTNNTQLTDTPLIDSTTGVNNSISVAGVGASGSVSFSVTDYSGSGDSVSAAALTAGKIDVAATNIQNVTVTTGMVTPTISGGLQNSISAAAVGASASQAISHSIMPALN